MSIITVPGLQMHISLPWVCCDPLSPPHWLTFHCSAQSSCYVQAERSTRLEQEGYDQVALPIVNGASASGTW